MLAWLGGSKRRRWHSNQSKKKGVNINNNSGGAIRRLAGDAAAGTTGENAVELSHVEHWANPSYDLNPATSRGNNRILPNALQIPSLDMFELADPVVGAAGLSHGFRCQPSRELSAGAPRPRPASGCCSAAASAAGAPAKRPREEPHSGPLRAAYESARGDDLNDAAADPDYADARTHFDAQPGGVCEAAKEAAGPSLAGSRSSSSSSDGGAGDPAFPPGRGRRSAAAAAGGRSSSGHCGFAGDPNSGSDPNGVVAAAGAAAAAAAAAARAGHQLRRCPAAQHPLPGGSGAGGQPVEGRAESATRRGAVPPVSLDILWLASAAT